MALPSDVFMSFCAGFSACVAAFIICAPGIDEVFHTEVGAIAVVWAMFSALPNLASTIDFGKRSVVGCFVSASVAWLLLFIGSAQRFVVLALSLPFVFLYCISAPACRTPLERIMNHPAALITHYIVLAFGPEEPDKSFRLGYSIVFFFCVGCGSGVVTHVSATMIFRHSQSFCSWVVERRLGECLDSLLNCAEGTLAYLTTGSLHRQVLEGRLSKYQASITRYEAAVEDWEREPWSNKLSVHYRSAIQSVLVTAAAQQHSMIETLGEGYSSNMKKLAWDRTSVQTEELRLSTIAALRAIGSFVKDTDTVDRDELATTVGKALVAAKDHSRATARHIRELLANQDSVKILKSLSAEDMLRARFAQLSMRRMAALTAELHQALTDSGFVDLRRTWSSSVFCNICLAQWLEFRQLFRPAEYFKAQLVDLILDQGEPRPMRARARQLIMYPMRLAICVHAVALSGLGFSLWYPTLGKYVMWSVLPCILCFLPTTGAVVLKSARRSVGTLLGGALGLLCIFCNPHNAPALLMQCFIVTFMSRYASTNKHVDYAGFCCGLTWQLVAFTHYQNKASLWQDSFEVATYRVIMTFIGSLLPILFALLFLPAHATVAFEKLTSDAILCTTEMCIRALDPSGGVGSRNEFDPDANKDAEGGLESGRFKISVVMLDACVRESLAKRTDMLTESQAERCCVSRRVKDLSELHEAAKTLGVYASPISASVLGLEHAKHATHFYNQAVVHGESLRHSIVKVHKELRHASLLVALLLRGARVQTAIGEHDLRSAVNLLNETFQNFRHEFIDSAKVGTLFSKGLDGFYSQVFALLTYAEKWMQMEQAFFKCKYTVTDEPMLSVVPPEYEASKEMTESVFEDDSKQNTPRTRRGSSEESQGMTKSENDSKQNTPRRKRGSSEESQGMTKSEVINTLTDTVGRKASKQVAFDLM